MYVVLIESIRLNGANMVTVMYSTAAQCGGKFKVDRFTKCYGGVGDFERLQVTWPAKCET